LRRRAIGADDLGASAFLQGEPATHIEIRIGVAVIGRASLLKEATAAFGRGFRDDAHAPV
jgi:hypothetical protein